MSRLLHPETLRRRLSTIAAAGLLPEAFGAQVLAAITATVPNDGQRLFGLDPATLLLNRLLAAPVTDGPFRRRWLHEIYLQQPDVPYFLPHGIMRSGAAAVLYHDCQDRSLGIAPGLLAPITTAHHRQVFHDGLTPPGGSLRLCLRDDTRWVGMLDIIRRDARRQFDPDEFATLEAIARLIGHGLGAALRREAARHPTAPADPERSGVVILDAHRHVTLATPAGEAWLERLWDNQPAGHAPVPTAVWAAVAALTADATSVPSIVARTNDGPVRIEAAPGATDDTVAIVLTPLRRPEPPTVPPEWLLTRQERRIVDLLLLGMRNRTLADALCVTENTVETHLRHIYAKLDVSNRTELLARLFHDVYLPALEPDTPEP